MATVAIVVVVIGLLLDTRILEELYLAKVVSCGQQSAVARPVNGVDVRVVEPRPDSLHREAKQTAG